MKVTLNFEGEDAVRDVKMAIYAPEAFGLIDEVERWLREKAKYSEEPPKSWDEVREGYYEQKEGFDLPNLD